MAPLIAARGSKLSLPRSEQPGSFTRHAWRLLAVVCLSVGAVNAFLPLLPTTVFWIVAAWAFGKSSPEVAHRLREHPRFGPGLTLWMDHRMISRRAKFAAILAIGCSYVFTLALAGLNAPSLVLGLGLIALAAYLGSRREPSSISRRNQDRVLPTERC